MNKVQEERKVETAKLDGSLKMLTDVYNQLQQKCTGLESAVQEKVQKYFGKLIHMQLYKSSIMLFF